MKSTSNSLAFLFSCLQFLIISYFLISFIFYSEKYSEIEDVYITSAIFENFPKPRLNLVLYIDSQYSLTQDIFLIDAENNTKLLDLENGMILSTEGEETSKIRVWSGDVSSLTMKFFISAEHSKTKALENHFGRPSLELKIIEAFNEPHEIVTCSTSITSISSIPNFLKSLISSISMGSFLHLPFDHLPSEIYKFLQHFVKNKQMRIEPEPMMRKTIDRLYMDSLDQLAQLHCLYMYRSKAKFLIFQNVQDVILPITEIDYFSEFQTIFLKNQDVRIMEYNSNLIEEKSTELLKDASFLIFEEAGRRRRNLIMRTPVFDTQVSSLYNMKLNNTQLNSVTVSKVRNFWRNSVENLEVYTTMKLNCERSKCSSSKCIQPILKHGSLHSMYSYNIHQSIFLQLDSFNC